MHTRTLQYMHTTAYYTFELDKGRLFIELQSNEWDEHTVKIWVKEWEGKIDKYQQEKL